MSCTTTRATGWIKSRWTIRICFDRVFLQSSCYRQFSEGYVDVPAAAVDIILANCFAELRSGFPRRRSAHRHDGHSGGTIVAKARAYQLVASKTLDRTEFRLTLGHVTTAQQLARISNDTGLQEDVGPGIVKYLTFTARHNFAHGFVQGVFSKADARDRLTGLPTPEAPRQIWDILATIDRLPFHLIARGEYEEVGRKPLGDGFVAVPVREFRSALVRPFPSRGFDIGINALIAAGYGGQTLETLSLPGEGSPFERITGFPLKSYVSASFTYYFRRR